MSDSEVLNAMRVPDLSGKGILWDVFQIGCTSRPLNFASQQMRAFKLTEALYQSDLIHKDISIAIIGGGLAGITAGIACLLLGAGKVTLFEKAHELMALQRGASHRVVHPYIFKWPAPDAEKRSTDHDFPLLNWSADSAEKIRAELVNEVEILFNRCCKNRNYKPVSDRPDLDFLKLRLGTEVRRVDYQKRHDIRVFAEGREPHFVEERNWYLPVGPYRNFDETFNIVIFAVGFGLEREFPGLQFRSYWQLDPFTQTTIKGISPRRCLVSGTGDGGLIDAIRLKLFDADQDDLTKILCAESGPDIGFLKPNVEHTLRRRKISETEINNEFENFIKGIQEIRKRLCDSMQALSNDPKGIKTEQTFRSLEKNHNDHCVGLAIEVLIDYLKSRERTDTLVYLNGTQDTPYASGSYLLHRFLIYLLRRYCGLRYRQGKLVLDARSSGRPHLVSFEHLNTSVSFLGNTEKQKPPWNEEEPLEFDDIIIRHGAISAIGQLFGEKVERDIQAAQNLKRFEESLWADRLSDSYTSALMNAMGKPRYYY